MVGSDVVIHKGAVLIGDLHIGDRTVVGENSVVIHDVPEGTVVSGVPAVRASAEEMLG